MKTKKISVKKIANLGLMLAVSLIISLIENALPPLVPIMPYAKLGLGNVILLFCFLLIGVWEGYLLLVLRCLFTAVFSGNYAALLWAFPAGLIAYTVMALMISCKKFSVPATSAMGGMLHNFVQILVASVIIGGSVFYYLPYMLVIGALCGLFTGFVCHFVSLAVCGKFGLKNYREFLSQSKKSKIEKNMETEIVDKKEGGERTDVIETALGIETSVVETTAVKEYADVFDENETKKRD